MTGIYQHSIDAKGRLFIPARLRDELGEVFYVTLSSENCLWAHSPASWERMMGKINAMTSTQQKGIRPLLSHAQKCDLDGQGRISLNKPLRDSVGLKSNVTVVGVGERAEFWDSDTWNAIDAVEATPENIAKVFMELDF